MIGRPSICHGSKDSIINGFSIPGRHDTHLVTALEAIPGALIGMALIYAEGIRRERAAAAAAAA